MGKISNLLVLMVMVAGGLYEFFMDGWFGVLHWGARVLFYFAVLYPLYKMGVLGAGDVKLMAATEGLFSWSEGVSYFTIVWLLAGLIALAKMLSQGNIIERLEYFFSYVADMVVMRKWQFYHEERVQGLNKNRTIRMSVPILLGFVLCMGG